MKKILIIFALGLTLMSCVGRDDLDIHGVEKVNLRGSTVSAAAVDVVILASNASGTSVKLRHANFTVYNGTSSIAEISILDGVVLPKRSVEQSVVLPLKVQFTGRLGMLSLLSISKGLDNVYISGEIEIKAGLGNRKLKFDRVPLLDFAKKYDIDLSALTNFKF